MARTGIKNALMKPFSITGLRSMSTLSRLSRPNHRKNTNEELEAAADERRPSADAATWWMPHPRTGIYFPKGQERVMDDIPNDAASFDCTFWFRSIDGVDDHKLYNDNFMDKYPN